MTHKNGHISLSRRPSRRSCVSTATRALSYALSAALVVPLPVASAQAGAGPARKEANAPQVTVNFVNAEIDAVARAMGAILNKQFVIDPRVKGTITVYSETPLSPREAYLNFLSALRGAGVAVVETNGLLKLVPEADAKVQTGTVSVGATRPGGGDQIATQIFRLQHENANNLVPVLRPLISPNNTINANPSNNTLIITDYAANLERLSKIIISMDVPTATDLEVIPVRYAVAADLAPLVQKMADAQGASSTPGAAPAAPAPGGNNGGTTVVMSDPRTNALLVRAPNASKLAIVKQVVNKLDTPGQSGMGGSNIHVVYLKHAEATKLAPILRASYFTGDGKNPAGGGGSSAPGGGGGGQNNPQNNTRPGGGGLSGGGASGGSQSGGGGLSAQATSPTEQSGGPQTGGWVQADPSTNSLIITAPEPMYRQLRTVIDQLDTRRAQIHVEALIVEVDATKEAELGVQWQSIVGQKGDSTIYGGGTNYGSSGNIVNLSGAVSGGSARTDTAKALAGGAISQGFNFGLVKKVGDIYTLGALAKFLQTNVEGNVLSTPSILTLDNEEAKIVVAENIPFQTGSYTNTGGGSLTSPFQTTDYRDVGLTLRIKPQIGENGTVRLMIFQESSNLLPNSPQGMPSTKKRSIESQVIVDDGAMLSIGGLIDDKYDGSESKVPLLGDIPILGGLFRSTKRTQGKKNLMVFLRPIVIKTAEDANKISMDRYDTIRALQEKQQPSSRWLLPINEAPILPPLPTPSSAEAVQNVPLRSGPASEGREPPPPSPRTAPQPQ